MKMKIYVLIEWESITNYKFERADKYHKHHKIQKNRILFYELTTWFKCPIPLLYIFQLPNFSPNDLLWKI